ncbi:MAG: hypothetical protein ACODAD_14475, partial [Planctomycetota bacterium]
MRSTDTDQLTTTFAHTLELLFQSEDWRKESDRALATLVGCSPTTIGKVRRELPSEGGDDYRIGRDGKQYPASPRPKVSTVDTCDDDPDDPGEWLAAGVVEGDTEEDKPRNPYEAKTVKVIMTPGTKPEPKTFHVTYNTSELEPEEVARAPQSVTIESKADETRVANEPEEAED